MRNHCQWDGLVADLLPDAIYAGQSPGTYDVMIANGDMCGLDVVSS